MASGPSLTPEDIWAVKEWREAGRGKVIVANTTFRAAPWADALFAMDIKWWGMYGAEVAETFKGQPYTTATLPIDKRRNVKKLRQFQEHRNSGAGAVSLAEHLGATQIAMLGYDCQHDGKLTHWHGSHPKGLGDAVSVARWPAKFAELARRIRIPVVNCSRETALTCFPRGRLEDFLGAGNFDPVYPIGDLDAKSVA
jgi:hypothetical protein